MPSDPEKGSPEMTKGEILADLLAECEAEFNRTAENADASTTLADYYADQAARFMVLSGSEASK